MPFVLCRLNPPRPTFPGDMTPEEAGLMQAHAAYWTGLLDRGTAVIFGPVTDPKGVWGAGILEIADGEDVGRLVADDPVVQAGAGFSYETYPMLQAVARPHGTR